MLYTLTETVVEYHADDLVAWKKGEKRKWIEGRTVPLEVYNQPEYHFGEYFVLNYFEKARWHGYCFYALGDWEPENPKLRAGRDKVRELFPPEQLTKFRKIRSTSTYPEGKGEPDLFLYMEHGPTLFLEVKKEGDRIARAQLECLAQIRGILGAEIGIVYLVKHGHQHEPRSYELDLDTYQGRRIES